MEVVRRERAPTEQNICREGLQQTWNQVKRHAHMHMSTHKQTKLDVLISGKYQVYIVEACSN